MNKISEIAQRIEENKKNIEILHTGLIEVDSFLEGGFLKKELVVLGAKTGGGKSLFGATIFKNIAMSGHKSAYFSLEISNEMIVSRLLGAEANISPTKIMIKMLQDDETEKKDIAKMELSAYDDLMYFYDNLYTLPEIVKAIKEGGYEFVVIDFIQNIITNTKRDEYERLSFVALELQRLAKEQNVCILVLSQVSNQMVRDLDRNKEIVEYKGSGSIATVCDLGFFIEKDDIPEHFKLRLRKNRRGVSGQDFRFKLMSPGGRVVDV